MRNLSLVFTFTLLSLSAAPTFAAPSDRSDIGMIVPLTGFVAEYGVAVRNGVELYKSDNPEKCGGVRFLWDDAQYDGPKTVSAFRSFLTKGTRLQYVWGSAPAEIAVPLAEKAKQPLFVLAEIETVQNRQFAFNMTNPAEDFSKYLVAELRRRGHKRLAIVKAEYVYFDRLVEGIRGALKADESVTVVASFQPGETNFRPTITKIAGGSYDAVGIYLNPDQGVLFLRQMAEQRIKLPAFGSTNFGSRKVIQDSQGTMEGALFSDTYVRADFRRRYADIFTDDSYVATAAQSYDMARVICGLPQGSEGQTLAAQISSTAPFDGASGRVSISGSIPEGRFLRFPVAVNVVESGQVKGVSVDGEQVNQAEAVAPRS
jgi:ABC-type branched-subunit amino acid transport system substrate-binding protein